MNEHLNVCLFFGKKRKVGAKADSIVALDSYNNLVVIKTRANFGTI